MRLLPALPVLLALGLAAAPAFGEGGTLSPRVFRALSAIYELRDEGQAGEALRDTQELLESRRLSAYERAQTQLLLVDLLLGEERYEDAIKPLRAALDGDGLPEARRAQTRYTLGQLYNQVGKHREALRTLEAWLKEADEVPPRAYFTLAVTCLELERVKDARRYADQARKAAGDKLSRAQYQFLAALYFQQADWRALSPLLVEAIGRFPSELRFWKQLTQTHLERRRETEALAVLRMAYAQRLLERGEDLVQMAQLLRMQGAPWEAAQVLEDGLRRKRIKADARHRLMLGEAWMAAREYERAYPVLRQVAEETRQASDWLRLTRLYAQNAVWSKCRESARAGLRARPEDPGPMQMLAGICAYEDGAGDDARSAFLAAQESRGTRSQAAGWLQLLEN